jgi:hypothetical protein
LGECRGEARVFSMGKEERRSGRRKREQWDWGRVREAGQGRDVRRLGFLTVGCYFYMSTVKNGRLRCMDGKI